MDPALGRLSRRALHAVRDRSAHAVVRALKVREHLDRGAASVALTFDDGPDPEHTPAILDELRRLGVLATFFLVGRRAVDHPDIVRRIIAEGHAVGSHSHSHPEPWTLPLPALLADYRRGREEVERAAQQPVPLFRPPKGHVDGRSSVAMLATRVRPWLWTIDPEDWVPDVGPSDIVGALSGLRGGDVVLLHDAIEGPLAPSALDRSATRAALPGIAALAGERNLDLVPLT